MTLGEAQAPIFPIFFLASGTFSAIGKDDVLQPENGGKRVEKKQTKKGAEGGFRPLFPLVLAVSERAQNLLGKTKKPHFSL